MSSLLAAYFSANGTGRALQLFHPICTKRSSQQRARLLMGLTLAGTCRVASWCFILPNFSDNTAGYLWSKSWTSATPPLRAVSPMVSSQVWSTATSRDQKGEVLHPQQPTVAESRIEIDTVPERSSPLWRALIHHCKYAVESELGRAGCLETMFAEDAQKSPTSLLPYLTCLPFTHIIFESIAPTVQMPRW